MKNLETSDDVEVLVRHFYSTVLKDPLLLPYFTAVREPERWKKHIEVFNLFWNNIIFLEGGYVGNPMLLHKQLHDEKNMEEKHFTQWLLLFHTSVDELFEGEKAAFAKSRASTIAEVMKLKILRGSEGP